MPPLSNTTNDVLIEEEMRANMWLQITCKNIWDRCIANSRVYKQPRINYLLDAFHFERQRLKFELAFETKEEQVIYAICEYVTQP